MKHLLLTLTAAVSLTMTALAYDRPSPLQPTLETRIVNFLTAKAVKEGKRYGEVALDWDKYGHHWLSLILR